ncbi:sulfite exporter TauE/SafE family protein [Pseudomonas sp. NPDC090592]|uniref:sulfite exporter TauE/SafE family protein n=1 Tax=Pseudomonas sp. NPDC090592 TaxID=3364480 RepID=UPI00383BD774
MNTLDQIVFISPLVSLFCLAAVFVAAFARGFAGFGFTLLSIMSLSFVLPLKTIVPAMVILEIAAGIKLLPAIWRHVHWRSIRVLVMSSVAATPIGAYLLAKIPGETVKVVLAVLTMACCLVLISGYKLQKMPSTLQTAATGAGAGLLNGSLGLGGPPVIVFFLGSPLALEAGRASIIAAFLAMDVAALPAFWMLDLFTVQALQLGVMSLPVLVVGVWCGSRMVAGMSEIVARRIIIVLLSIMAVGSLLGG